MYKNINDKKSSSDPFSSNSERWDIKAELNQEKLVAALTAVNSAQMDTELGHLTIQFLDNGMVAFSGVNHNMSIKYIFEANYTGTGCIKVSGKQFSEYIKQLPATKITLTAELPTRIVLKCERSSVRMQLVQDQNINEINPSMGTSCVMTKGHQLGRWISSFRDFVQSDDTRFFANGALIWADRTPFGDTVFAVASDSLRLAKSTLYEGLKIEALDESQVLVPKKALEELRRMAISEPEKDFTLKWSNSDLSFSAECDGYTLFVRCIAGQYPPYETAIPQRINNKIMLDTKKFLESVRRCLVFTDKAKGCVLKLEANNSLLTIESITQGQQNEASEKVEIATTIESSFDVLYQGNLLAAILNIASGNKVEFAWENVNRPVKITGEEQRGINVFYLLVPSKF